ncbi:F-box protein cpr1 [Thalictrum thalictroides]|uniref:F-box protein cpr1 n=1 Tax=Thalictrum thalictroides TaxID=46969 RepID=A0A7J6VVB4_THATH|nr:F-box protein cpr1 [Thalictrum thalictroides]
MKTQATKRGLISLPEEILFDVFSRLLIKDLFRFRSVCKDWKKVITDSYFVDMHNARKNPDQYGSNFLIKCCTSTSDETLIYFVDYENHDTTSSKAFNINFKLPYSTKIKLVGSSNGLLCLCSLPDHEAYYICNPLTREVWHLPRPYDLDKDCEKKMSHYSAPLGFAFDKTTNTYKVVFTWCFYDKIYDHSKLKSGVGIYTLGSGKWRRVEDVPARRFFNPQETSQVLVNGALHWILLCEPKSELYNSIGAIDIQSESFRAFKMPREYYGAHRTLGVLQESLCVIDDICAGFVDAAVVFWVMKDYGNKDSWRKEYIVKKDMLGPLQRARSFKFFNTRKPKTVLLYGDKDDQGYYDLENKEFKHTLNNGIQPSSNKVEAVVVHLGSLISPKRIDFPSAQMISKTPARTRPKRKLSSAQTSKTPGHTRPKQKLKKSLRS